MSVSLSTNICLPFSSQTVRHCHCQSQCHCAYHCQCHILFHYQPNHLLVFKLPSSPALSLSVILMLLTFFFIMKKTHLFAFQLPNSPTASFCLVNQLHFQGSRQIARPCFDKMFLQRFVRTQENRWGFHQLLS